MVTKRTHVLDIKVCGCNFDSKEARVNFTPFNLILNSRLKDLLDFLFCHVLKVIWICKEAERREQWCLVITRNGVDTSAWCSICNTGILVVFISKNFSLKFTYWNESSLRPDACYWVIWYSVDYHSCPLWHKLRLQRSFRCSNCGFCLCAYFLNGKLGFVKIVDVRITPYKVATIAVLTCVHQTRRNSDKANYYHDQKADDDAEAGTPHIPIRQPERLCQGLNLLLHALLPGYQFLTHMLRISCREGNLLLLRLFRIISAEWAFFFFIINGCWCFRCLIIQLYSVVLLHHFCRK